MAISQVLLFVGSVVGLLSLVPLCTWAATGRLRDAWHAWVGYSRCLLILAGIAAALIVAGLIGSVT